MLGDWVFVFRYKRDDPTETFWGILLTAASTRLVRLPHVSASVSNVSNEVLPLDVQYSGTTAADASASISLVISESYKIWMRSKAIRT